MSTPTYESLQEIVEHENKDYPVGVYYVQPDEMIMEHVRWHWHTEIEIDFIKEGRAEYRVGEQNFTLSAGQAVLINQNIMHCIKAADESPCVIMSLIFSPNFLFPQKDSVTAKNYLLPIQSDEGFRTRIFETGSDETSSPISKTSSTVIYRKSSVMNFRHRVFYAICGFCFYPKRIPSGFIPLQKLHRKSP